MGCFSFNSFGAVRNAINLVLNGGLGLPQTVDGSYKVYGIEIGGSTSIITLSITENDTAKTPLFSIIIPANTNFMLNVPFIADSGLIFSSVGTTVPTILLIRSNTE